MKKIVETGITRRAAIAAAAVGGISLLMPKGVLAAEFQTLDQNRIDYFVRPDLTENQFDAMLRERAEEEAAQIIEQALAGYDGDARAGGRPTYDTVYGSVVNKSTGWHDVAGQPAGGVQISGGCSIFVSPSGGGSVGVSVSLPGGVGSVSVSIPKANRSLSVTGYAVNISGSGFYKATANVTHKIQPYVVYETTNGVRRVYAKMATNTFYSMALGKRKVG